jgi:2-oxoglutarate ferredoxin oxidoreductase subunit delta
VSYKYQIEVDRCKGCRLCVDICPQNVLEISTTANNIGYFPAFQVNPDDCTICRFCCNMCPDVAITVEQIDDNKDKSGK